MKFLLTSLCFVTILFISSIFTSCTTEKEVEPQIEKQMQIDSYIDNCCPDPHDEDAGIVRSMTADPVKKKDSEAEGKSSN
ncbi:hypothetical protein [Flammeovirga sp. SJP92]|uniref:hypothetical protein n=1 Tax=Flammeovirga sp. SJP92 TaxID=1775430 RepID=UPI0007890380|nr:hypothetical protein [Flammeovirga sp. SJP92]KXX72733.1 hypothetical protein AVL50_32045 [Flammeovirga sp. SJP92]